MENAGKIAKILKSRRDAIRDWIVDEMPETIDEQAHLEHASVEHAYWHHGYQAALDDVIILLDPAQETHIAGRSSLS